MSKLKNNQHPTFSRIEVSYILNVSTLTISNREKGESILNQKEI